MKLLCVALSFIIGFFTYPLSFLKTQTEFEIPSGVFSNESFLLNGEDCGISTNYEVDENGCVMITDKLIIEIGANYPSWFNYYALSYTTDAYLKGELTYRCGVKEKTEVFYLEPSDDGKFYSFIDNFLNGTKANGVEKLTFEPLDKNSAEFTLKGMALFNRGILSEELYRENSKLKIGVNLLWGGTLSYVEDLDSNVQVVEHNGAIKVDSNAAERYNTKSLNNHVNLINRNDTGRLVQQSYYGVLNGENYTPSYYNETLWHYNPVQGGNQFNENSKIVDVRLEDDLIYIKCQPLDWAKRKEFISPSYMEAYYSLDGSMVCVTCRFVDFSGYEETSCPQEVPAFYCVEPLGNYVYYAGDKPWTNGELTYRNDLIFWPDAGYPYFYSKEHWSGFIGEFEDSFGIGVYVNGEDKFLAGVYERGKTTKSDPSLDGPTSYIAVVKDMAVKSFEPYQYDYCIATGNTDEIRAEFSRMK